MSEVLRETPNLPSGYRSVEQLPQPARIDGTVLPWLRDVYDLSLAHCELDNGASFLLASAVGTHPDLVKAAEAMNDHEQRSTNNMFYSRLASFVDSGHSPQVETLPEPSTPFPVRVMRNKSGQRVYFAVPRLVVPSTVERPQPSEEPVVIRLGACDKNKQKLVVPVLTKIDKNMVKRKLK